MGPKSSLSPLLHVVIVALVLLTISFGGSLVLAEESAKTSSPFWSYLPLGLGLGYLIADGDHQVYRILHDHRDDHVQHVSDFLTRSGDGKSILGIVALSYGTGYFSENRKLQESTLMGIEALVASGLITETLKHLSGRQRPVAANGEDQWNGPRYFFRRDDDYFDAFPSGHSTASFALATSFALQYPDGWVPYLAYTWATGVAASRVYNEVHWTSDVLVGSAIGYLTARAMYRYHRNKGNGIIVIPYVVSDAGTATLGLTFSTSFQ